MNPKAQTTAIELPKLDVRMLEITLMGDSPLISHRWSEKAKEMILSKQMKKAQPKKEAKNPQREFEDSLYKDDSGAVAFPAIAFKNAAVDACSHVDGVTKVTARGAFHIVGEMIPINGAATMREDMVRIGMGVADIRYRGEFKEWSATIQVRYNANVLSAEQIVNLFNTPGFAIGVGEWRPQKDGIYGMFHVATEQEMARVAA